MSVKTALSMGRVGQNVLNGLPTGDASLYVDDKIGGFVGCAHGAVADLQCSEGGSPMDFERDELGNWWLSGIYKQPEYRVFNPKTDLGLPTFVERRPR